MQKASVMKGTGLKPLEDEKSAEVAHVFGKNLEERVITKDEEEEESPSISSFNVVQENQTPEEGDIESIRKRKFDAITGEEDEETIFQGEFKLFVWDLATSNWIEKGRGQLKLNDSIGEQERKSRIIMRVSGTLRIILNVAVNRSFFKVIANSKTNIRFTDSQTVWAASGNNAHQLRDLIEKRLMLSAEEEENEIRKRSKSDIDGGEEFNSKKTRACEEVEESPKPVEASENESSSNDKGTSDKSPSTHDSKDTDEDDTASDESENELTEQDSKSPKKEDKLDTRNVEENGQKLNGGEKATTVDNGEER